MATKKHEVVTYTCDISIVWGGLAGLWFALWLIGLIDTGNADTGELAAFLGSYALAKIYGKEKYDG